MPSQSHDNEIGSYTQPPIAGCTCNAQPGDLHFPDCPCVHTQCTCGANANRGQRHANSCELSVFNHSIGRDHVNAEMANVMRSGRRQVVHQAAATMILNASRLNELIAQERKTLPTAPALLAKAADIMAERGKQYDKPAGERSMAQTVAVFNLHHGTNLTEAQGWHFMRILKDVRLFTRDGYHADSADDGIAYQALMAEAKAKEAA